MADLPPPTPVPAQQQAQSAEAGYVDWKSSLRQASFRGVPFYVQKNSKQSGRRTAPHEYPKNDTPYAEDMGRRSYKFLVLGYIVGPFFFSGKFSTDRDNLEAALEDRGNQGPGQLILPTRGQTGVISNLFTCVNYTTNERQVWGGYAEFEMLFQEYGTAGIGTPTVVTATGVANATSLAAQSALQFFNNNTSNGNTLRQQVPTQ